ncbi:endonuclease V-like isoform X3 [Vanacampus margaritifer]
MSWSSSGKVSRLVSESKWWRRTRKTGRRGQTSRDWNGLLDWTSPSSKVLYGDSQMVTLTAPYMAGFLAFRETPFFLEALQRLEREKPALVPQVLFVDGNGLFHYREFGLACHLGVLSGLPCVGVAKNLLQVQGVNKNEEHQSQISALQKGGDSFPLRATSGKVLGKALRSSDKSTKPVYVSVGHKITLDTAVHLTHSCCRFRVPEPIRQADYRSREYLRAHFPVAETGSTESKDKDYMPKVSDAAKGTLKISNFVVQYCKMQCKRCVCSCVCAFLSF